MPGHKSNGKLGLKSKTRTAITRTDQSIRQARNAIAEPAGSVGPAQHFGVAPSGPARQGSSMGGMSGSSILIIALVVGLVAYGAMYRAV